MRLHIIISASPPARLVGVLVKQQRPLDLRRIKLPYQQGPDVGFVSGRPSATPEYRLRAHRLQIC